MNCVNCDVQIEIRNCDAPFWCEACLAQASHDTGMDAFNLSFQAWNERCYNEAADDGFANKMPDPRWRTGVVIPFNANRLRAEARAALLLENAPGPQSREHIAAKANVAMVWEALTASQFTKEGQALFSQKTAGQSPAWY